MFSAGRPPIICRVRWLRSLSDLLFSPVCRVCRRTGEFPICPRCLAAFHLIVPPWCDLCGRPLPPQPPLRCAACRRDPPIYSRARHGGVYEGALREAIHALKFNGCRTMAVPLGDLIATVIERDGGISADLVVPVPLHPSRYRQRGFNQAELIGRRVARALDLPCDDGLLRRAHATGVQSNLTREARKTNVEGAFICSGPITRRAVLLVDDVMSTGFTASECARALRLAGATDVAVATAAAAVLSSLAGLTPWPE